MQLFQSMASTQVDNHSPLKAGPICHKLALLGLMKLQCGLHLRLIIEICSPKTLPISREAQIREMSTVYDFDRRLNYVSDAAQPLLRGIHHFLFS